MMTADPKPKQDRKCCAWCGDSITGPLWKRYCSDACKMKSYRARKKRRETDRPGETVTTNRNSVTE